MAGVGQSLRIYCSEDLVAMVTTSERLMEQISVCDDELEWSCAGECSHLPSGQVTDHCRNTGIHSRLQCDSTYKVGLVVESHLSPLRC